MSHFRGHLLLCPYGNKTFNWAVGPRNLEEVNLHLQINKKKKKKDLARLVINSNVETEWEDYLFSPMISRPLTMCFNAMCIGMHKVQTFRQYIVYAVYPGFL